MFCMLGHISTGCGVFLCCSLLGACKRKHTRWISPKLFCPKFFWYPPPPLALSAPKCFFFQGFEGLPEVFDPGRPHERPRDAARCPARKLSPCAVFSFVLYRANGRGGVWVTNCCWPPLATRKIPEKQTVGTTTASHKMLTAQALSSALNAGTAERGCLGRGNAFV